MAKQERKKRVHLKGKHFGEFQVLERVNKPTYWRCLCSCGREFIERSDRIRDGRTTCGKCIVFNGKRIPITDEILAARQIRRWYKNNADLHNRAFQLTLEDVYELTYQKCSYCGQVPSVPAYTSRKRFLTLRNGIDRKDSDQGYTLDNCTTCCWRCNRAKANMSNTEFLEWIYRIANHQNYKVIDKGQEVSK